MSPMLFIYEFHCFYGYVTGYGMPSFSFFLSFRYSGTNTGNVHIIADLYAEVTGVLAQSK